MDRIFIGVKEMAASMGVSEKTIYRMLTDNQFPFAVKIGGQWRFRADSVDRWLVAQSEAGSTRQSINYRITLFNALLNGSVLYRIHGANRDEALDELLSILPNTGGFNTKNLKFSILDREALVPSSLAGIACMAPSDEHPVFMEQSLIILAYLEQPTDFKALDGVPARVVFLLLPANIQEMAILRTRLQRLLMEPAFVNKIMKELPRKEMLECIRTTEERILRQPSGKKEDKKPRTAAASATTFSGAKD
ncbi:MAG: helix-turn-helix domain-containing protein [Proteobacteria bacterium]|nr:helix-turn-helix domain-containing protein [Pseudomonadota bacterium]MBU1737859.1 helix-turn-helix domain-containing protein [Pseudomonadota bacterium]